MALKRNADGLLTRAQSYGRTSHDQLAKELGLNPNETLYRAGVEKEPARPAGLRRALKSITAQATFSWPGPPSPRPLPIKWVAP